MIDVSSAYLEAQDEPLVETRVTIIVTQSDGLRTVTIDNTGISDGSFSVSRQARSASDEALGGVFIGECKFTVMGGVLDNINLQNARIRVISGLKLLDDTWEEYPVGEYTIAKAPRKKDDIEITAYDDMQKLEIGCGITSFYDTPYSILSIACNECGVSLASTRAEIESLPNGNEAAIFNAHKDASAPSTWRDLVSLISTFLGGFAYFDAGGLRVGVMHTSPDMTSDGTRRIGTEETFEAYVARWTAMIGSDEDGVVWRVASSQDDGDVTDIGMNLFFASGLNAYRTRVRNAVFTSLKDESVTPFSVTMQEPPIFDLGDRITFSGGNTTSPVQGCVMFWEWTLHSGVKVEGYGDDPALSGARSVEESSLATVYSRLDSDNVQYYPFVNTSAYVIGPRTRVASITFASKSDTTVQFDCNVWLKSVGNQEITYDGNVIASKTYKRTNVLVEYELNGEVLDVEPIDSFVDGDSIMHLFRPIGAQPDVLNTLDIYFTASDGTVNIGVGSIRAMISGRGLAANENEWRSTQTFNEQVSFSLLGSLDVDISENLATTLETPIQSGISESLAYSLLGALVVGYTASVGGSGYYAATFNTTLTGGVTYANGAFVAGSAGTLTTDELGTDATVTGIAALACVCSGTVRIECDFGDGYKQWNGSGWASSTGGNVPETIAGLTTAQWAQGYTDSLVIRANMDAGAVINALSVEYIDDWS